VTYPNTLTAALRRDTHSWQNTVQHVDGWAIATDGARAHAMRHTGSDSERAGVLRSVVLAIHPPESGQLNLDVVEVARRVQRELGRRWRVNLDLADGTIGLIFAGKERTDRDDARLEELGLSSLERRCVGKGIPGSPPAIEIRYLVEAMKHTGSSVVRFSKPHKRWGRTDPIRLDSDDGERFAVVMPVIV
jgi:hypothetical protein